jgi:SAM-dependent methyltransferase
VRASTDGIAGLSSRLLAEKQRLGRAVYRFRTKERLPRDPLKRARRYVRSDAVSGSVQLELLRREGCVPTSHVLEVGCGALSAGAYLIDFLDADRYVGIEPNRWLIDAALRERRVRRAVREKRPVFIDRIDFDASEAGRRFDFVLSHSVLSHAAHWQLDQFLANVVRTLAPNGRILASLILAEGNPYGSTGTPDKRDSMHTEWQYPGISWFSLATVVDAAARHGRDRPA